MKLKKITSMLLVAALALPLQPLTSDTSTALAAENLMANESVYYATVNSMQEFRDYIDNDGLYASQDTIETSWSGFTDVHKIVVEEAGTLLIAPLNPSTHIDLFVYSNFALTSQVAKAPALTSSMGNITSIEVKKAGTYYYRGDRWNGADPDTITTYVGFIPKNGAANVENKYNTAPDTATPISAPIPLVSGPEGLIDYINSDGAFMSQDTIETSWSGTSAAHSFTIAEDGWIFAYALAESDNVNLDIYSNKDLTSRIARGETTTNTENAPIAVYAKAGTYYYNGERWNGHKPFTFSTYIGFMPATNRISVAETSYSEDMTSATVTLNYDKEYLGNFLSGTIRLVKGWVEIADVNNDDIWKTDTRENALENATIKITENGKYTVRIANSSDSYYCLAQFEVKGLKEASKVDKTKPAAPKVTAAKKGKKVVKGTADANVKITVKIGKKTYTTIANASGKWTAKLKQKLKKGNKVKVFAANSAAVKSSTTTYKVK